MGKITEDVAVPTGGIQRVVKTRTQLDVLAAEIDSLRSRCDELEAENDRLAEIVHARGCAKIVEDCAKLEAERDEARQWARKLYRENADLRATIESMLRVEKMRADAMIDLRRQLKDAQFQASVDEVRAVSNADARDAELAEARDAALDEADQAVFEGLRTMWGLAVGVEVTRHVRAAVTNLKDRS